jgi:hypothetical protein
MQYNPGDHIIDVTSMDFRSPDSEAVTRKRVELLAELYAQQGTKQSVSGVPDRMAGFMCRRGRRSCMPASGIDGPHASTAPLPPTRRVLEHVPVCMSVCAGRGGCG